MNKPSQITNQNADKSNKKQWTAPTIEVIGADIINNGTDTHHHEGSTGVKGSPTFITKNFIS